MSDDQALATVAGERAPIVLSDRGVQLGTFDELARFCVAIAKSRLAPKGFETPEAIMVAVQMGMEVGLGPLSALQNICVINNKPALYGDAALALVRASGLLESFGESWERDGKIVDNLPAPLQPGDRAICRCQRRGSPVHVSVFTYEDAKHAKLIGKAGPWSDYPSRMMQMRARSFGLRDEFSDILKGFRVAEEVNDYGKPVQGRVVDAAAGLVLPVPEPSLPSERNATHEESAGVGAHNPTTHKAPPDGNPEGVLL